jgi:hypothetical protein
MLLLPWLAGVLTAGFRWLHLPLLVTWLAGYLASYYLLLAVKTGRLGRVRTQLVVYGAPAAVLGAVILALRPQLLWYAPAYALLFAVNVGYARRRRERALLNGLASVVQSCLMVFVCATVAGVPPGRLSTVFLAMAAYFAGTVLYVKTMIRERDHAGYRRASIAYHVLAVAAMAWLSGPVTAVFTLLLARAWLLPGRRLRPAHVGLIEIAASALLLLAVAV